MNGIHACVCGWCGVFERMIKRAHELGIAYHCPRCRRLVVVKHEKGKGECLLKK